MVVGFPMALFIFRSHGASNRLWGVEIHLWGAEIHLNQSLEFPLFRSIGTICGFVSEDVYTGDKLATLKISGDFSALVQKGNKKRSRVFLRQ